MTTKQKTLVPIKMLPKDHLSTIVAYTLFKEVSPNNIDILHLTTELVNAIKRNKSDTEQHEMEVVVDCLTDLAHLNKNNFCMRDPKEIMDDFGIVPTRELTITTPIIPIHKNETIKLKALYEKYDNHFTIIQDRIGAMMEEEHQWKLGSELGNLPYRIHKDEALREILQQLIQTLRDIKQVNIIRRANTARRLLFLPARGTINKFPADESHKIPPYYLDDDNSSLFVTWQYIGRIAELKNLTWQAAIKKLAEMTENPVKDRINHLNLTNPNISSIIDTIQEEYENFPREEDWNNAFNNFTRDKGQSIQDAYDKLFQITIRKYHQASNEDAADIFIKAVYENIHKFTSKKGFKYIKDMEKGERPDNITMIDVQRRLALAKHFEETTTNWETKFLTDSEKNRILRFSGLTEKEKERKLSEISMTMWSESNPFRGDMNDLFDNKDKENKPTQTVRLTSTRGSVNIEYKYVNPNLIIEKSEIEQSTGRRTKISHSINHNRWKCKYVRLF